MEFTAPSLSASLVSTSPKSALTMSYKGRRQEKGACSTVGLSPTYLAVVEGSGNGNVVYIGIKAGCHLGLLDLSSITSWLSWKYFQQELVPTGLTRSFGCSMKTETSFLPLRP